MAAPPCPSLPFPPLPFPPRSPCPYKSEHSSSEPNGATVKHVSLLDIQPGPADQVLFRPGPGISLRVLAVHACPPGLAYVMPVNGGKNFAHIVGQTQLNIGTPEHDAAMKQQMYVVSDEVAAVHHSPALLPLLTLVALSGPQAVAIVELQLLIGTTYVSVTYANTVCNLAIDAQKWKVCV